MKDKEQIILNYCRNDVDMSLRLGMKLDQERLRTRRRQNVIKSIFIFGMMGVAIILIKVIS